MKDDSNLGVQTFKVYAPFTVPCCLQRDKWLGR